MTTRRQNSRDKFIEKNFDRLVAQGRAANGEQWEAAADAQSDGGAELRAAADRGLVEKLTQGEQLVLDTIDACVTVQTIASLAENVLDERMSLKGITDAVMKLEQLDLVKLARTSELSSRAAALLSLTDDGKRIVKLVQDITTYVAIGPFGFGTSTTKIEQAVRRAKQHVSSRTPYTINVYAVKRFQYVTGMGGINYRGDVAPVLVKTIDNIKPRS